MGSQPNFANRSEVVSIYKCPTPKPLGALPQIWGAKHQIFDKPKCYCQSTMCPLKVGPLSVTFDPENAEIRSVIVIQHFPSLPGFPHKGHWTQANQICQMLEGLRGLLSSVKILGKFVPKNFVPSLNWNLWAPIWPTRFSRLPHSTPHISGKKRRIDKKYWYKSTMCPLKFDLLFRDLWLRNGWDPFHHLTHPMKIQHFLFLPGFSQEDHWTQANQTLRDVRVP